MSLLNLLAFFPTFGNFLLDVWAGNPKRSRECGRDGEHAGALPGSCEEPGPENMRPDGPSEEHGDKRRTQ